MQENVIGFAMPIIKILAPCLLFSLLLLLTKGAKSKKIFLAGCEELGGFLKKKTRELSWYQHKKEWLTKNGAFFHFGDWITPIWFLTIRLFVTGAGFFLLATWNIVAGMIAIPLLFFATDFLLLRLNSRDNDFMLPQLRLIYHALEIQIKAGVYVTDALAECYSFVQEKRLKQALLDLAGDIVMKADIYDSIESFQSKFNNRHVDSLCITLLQTLESGRAVDLLRDLSEQIKDMEGSLLARRKGALDRSLTFYQLGILAAVMGIVLYACVTQMFQTTIY